MTQKNSEYYSLFLSLGSNLGEKEGNIELALKIIEKRIGNLISISAFYYSPPKDFISSNNFVNCTCEVETNMCIYDAFAQSQCIEKQIGRKEKSKSGKYNDRIIDIDLLIAGNLIINSEKLTIPHPRLHERDFVLIPFCEIAPKVVHPVLNKTIYQLCNELLDVNE